MYDTVQDHGDDSTVGSVNGIESTAGVDGDDLSNGVLLDCVGSIRREELIACDRDEDPGRCCTERSAHEL